VNTSWPMPQRTLWKNSDCVMNFGRNLLGSLLMSAIYSFVKYYATNQQEVTTLKIYNWGFDRLCAQPIFLPFSTLLWVLIHTLGTTAIDQLTNHCVKLQQHVRPFLNLLQSHGNSRLRLRFANTQPFPHCVNRVDMRICL